MLGSHRQASAASVVAASPKMPPNPAPALIIAGAPQALVQAPLAPPPKQDVPSPPLPLPVLPTSRTNDNPTGENSLSPLRDLHRKATEKIAGMDGYILRLRRREVVGTTKNPEELMLCKFRKDPWSVYFKWLGTEGKGREVAFSKGQYDGLIHTLTAPGDILFFGGKVFKVAPDSVLVRSKSRYPITEAGLGTLIERFGKMVSALEKGETSQGTAKYLGTVKRPEFEYDLEAVVQGVAPGLDPNLPKGGQRFWYFDPTNHLPALIVTRNESNQEVEYYCHDRIIKAQLTDDDFNPDKLWKK